MKDIRVIDISASESRNFLLHLLSLVFWQSSHVELSRSVDHGKSPLDRSIVNEGEPVLYYLKDGPGRGFVREELIVVPRYTELPPLI